MKTSQIVKFVVLVMLIAAAGMLWARKLQAPKNSVPPAIETAQGAPAATPAVADWKKECAVIYDQRHPDPEGAELLVLYPDDQTGLQSLADIQMSDNFRMLVANWTALGGKPLTTAATENIRRMLSRRKAPRTGLDSLSIEQAADLGRGLGSQYVVQLSIDRNGTSETVARARVVDVKTNAALGEWSVSTSEPEPSYDALLDSQVALAPRVAAAICGVESGEALIAQIAARTASAADQPAEEATLAKARDLLTVSAQPRVHRAMRLAGDIVQKNPGNTEAWLLLAYGHNVLGSQFSETETPTKRREGRRAFVAASTAYLLAPETPYGRYAHTLSMAASGRVAQMLRTTEAYAKANPNDFITNASYANAWGKPELFPSAEAAVTPQDKAFREFFDQQITAQTTPQGWAKLDEEIIKRAQLAPFQWLATSRRVDEKGQIGTGRQMASSACVQGSLIALVEAMRVYERQGDKARVEALKSKLAKLKISPATVADSSTPLSDGLMTEFEGISSKQLADLGREFCGAQGGSFGGNLVTLACAEVEEARSLVAKKPGVRAAGNPVLLEDEAALEVGVRVMADAAARMIHDFGVMMGSAEAAVPAVEFFEKLLGDDVALIDGIAHYHHSGVFNNLKVDEYHGKVRALVTGYMPALRRMSNYADGTDKRRQVMRDLRSMDPLGFNTLYYVGKRLEEGHDYEEAEKSYAIMAATFPRYDYARQRELECRAKAQRRLVTKEEADAFLASVSTPDKAERQLFAYEVYWKTGLIDETTSHLEAYIQEAKPEDRNSHWSLAQLYLLRGDKANVERAMMGYINQAPRGLQKVNAWMDLSGYFESLGDMPAAVKAAESGVAVNTGQGTQFSRPAYLKLRQGDALGAAALYMEGDRMYPGYQIGYALRALMEIDREDELMPQVEAALSKRSPQGDTFAAKAAALRKKGDIAGAEAAVMTYNGWMAHEPQAAINISNHYWNVGDLEKAALWAEHAVERSVKKERVAAYYHGGIMAARIGATARAKELAAVLRAQWPMEKSEEMILAEIAMQANDPDGALRELNYSLVANYTDALSIAARAHLAKGDPQTAYGFAKRAVDKHTWDDWQSPVALLQAASASGHPEDAQRAAEICRRLGPNSPAAAEVTKMKL